ncbi:MAG TPA: ribonuclease HII [Vicinamibacterales bacterium]|nr:ribonuclease HII [Vicinamibacterales bacterium]
MPRPRAARTIENALRRLGFHRIAGVDEVGRGCLAGPVMAGAVVLDPGRHIPGLRDSKVLSPPERERLHGEIARLALGWAVASVEPDEIDRINIHQATLRAMREAVLALNPLPDLVLVDAFRIPGLLIPQRAVVHGDARCSAIAAGSIVAKVVRDRHMAGLHEIDPRYGFGHHKGYATAEHLAALALHGYSPIHRRSFRPPSLFDLLEPVAPGLANPGPPADTL